MRPIQKRQLLGIMELEEPEKVEVLQPEEHFEQFLFPVISEVQEAIVPRTGVHRKAYDIIGSGCRKWAINSSNKTQVESLGKSTLNYFQNQWSQGQSDQKVQEGGEGKGDCKDDRDRCWLT
uniref:Uncharacterized protein n=1 Tax=Bos indicus x Bos taurus TaxID=30522 RepID=A0A4W2FTW2_BOBOX